MKGISLLQKPHPFISNRNSLLIPFVITVLVLVVFRPFELGRFPWPKLLGWALLFGGVAAGCVFAVVQPIWMARLN